MSFCVFFIFLMNMVPLGVSLWVVSSQSGTSCAKPLEAWLAVAVVDFTLNLCMAVYVYNRISLQEDMNFAKMSQFLMYDVGVALYIVLSIFTIVWGIVGLSWLSSEPVASTCSGSSLYAMVSAAAIILEVFCSIGVLIVFFTLCNTCQCFQHAPVQPGFAQGYNGYGQAAPVAYAQSAPVAYPYNQPMNSNAPPAYTERRDVESGMPVAQPAPSVARVVAAGAVAGLVAGAVVAKGVSDVIGRALGRR